jgi:chromosome segregation ATPase
MSRLPEQSLTSLNTEFKNYKEQAEIRINELQAKFNELETYSQRISNEKDTLAAQLAEAAQILGSLNELVREKQALEQSASKLEADLSSQREQSEARIAELIAQAAELNEKCQAAAVNNDELVRKLDEVTQKLTEKEFSCDDQTVLHARLASLETERDVLSKGSSFSYDYFFLN